MSLILVHRKDRDDIYRKAYELSSAIIENRKINLARTTRATVPATRHMILGKNADTKKML